jgi:hypothetical protein
MALFDEIKRIGTEASVVLWIRSAIFWSVKMITLFFRCGHAIFGMASTSIVLVRCENDNSILYMGSYDFQDGFPWMLPHIQAQIFG